MNRPPSCCRFTRSGPPSCEASSSRRLSSSSSFCQSTPGAPLLFLSAAVVAALGIALAQERDELLLLLLRQGVEPASVASAVVAVSLLRHVTPPQGAVIIRDARWNRGRPRVGIRRPCPTRWCAT